MLALAFHGAVTTLVGRGVVRRRIIVHRCVVVMLLRASPGREGTKAVVVALHVGQHVRRRRVRQRDAEQQNDNGPKLLHAVSLSRSGGEGNLKCSLNPGHVAKVKRDNGRVWPVTQAFAGRPERP